MKGSSIVFSLVAATAAVVAAPAPASFRGRLVCPQLHVFGARETTAPPGFGTSQVLVDLITKRFPGSTAEPIIYPAAGGNNYSQSVRSGIVGVLAQMEAFYIQCPQTILIMHGYSQVGKDTESVSPQPRIPSLSSGSGD